MIVAAIVLFLGLVAPPAAQAGLASLDDQIIGGNPRLHELTLASAALKRDAKVRILLPGGYDDPLNASVRYPVLYLLHGAGDDQRAWTRNTDVVALTKDLPLIVVMPEAGRSPESGWYSDWQNGPAWESFHIGELIPYMDAAYRTIDDREGRAVAGLSMGGFGAMSYAARHPGLFVAAASFSGAVDTTAAGQGEAALFKALRPYFGTPDDNVWGPYPTQETRWRTHNPTDLAPNLRWSSLWLSTGNGVLLPGDDPSGAPVEAGVYAMNTNFHDRLDRLGIAHEWRDRGYGTHEWHYWQADLHAWLPVLMSVFASPPQAPDAFDYRSAEQSFSAWGWDFTTNRPGPQFVDLSAVSAAGLTVSGSGLLTVSTAPLFAPRSRHRVVVEGAGDTSVTADGAGRLRFSVDLGPGRAAPPSPAAGIQVALLDQDRRVSRQVTITDPP